MDQSNEMELITAWQPRSYISEFTMMHPFITSDEFDLQEEPPANQQQTTGSEEVHRYQLRFLRGLKPSYSLLDCNMVPKIGDFVLSDCTCRQYDDHQAGSMCYPAPKYLVSRKNDVYSYGIILLKLIIDIRCFLFSNEESRDDNGILKRATRRFRTGCAPYRTRSSRSLEINALLEALYGEQTTTAKWNGRHTLKTDIPRSFRKHKSFSDALLSKRDHGACAENNLTLGSYEEDDKTMVDAHRSQGVFSQAGLCLDGSVETPIGEAKGGTISSGGPDHPAAADSLSITTPCKKVPWLLATSAACHVTGDDNELTDYTPKPGNHVVHVPNYGPMVVLGTGSVRTPTMFLDDVMHIPGLDKNLVSASQLGKLGCAITLGPSCCITKDHAIVGEAHFNDDYLVELDFLRVP